MVSLRVLLIVTLLFATISCADKSSKPATPQEPQPTKTESTETPPLTKLPSIANFPLETTPPPVVGEKFIDAYTSVLIQEIKNQLASDPLVEEKRIKNVEFANRISKINYKYGRTSELKIITYGNKSFKFIQTSAQGNVQFFNARNDSKEFNVQQKGSLAFTAQVKTIRYARANKTVTIIKIKDLDTHAIVHIFYVKKTGTVTASMVKGYDYGRDLTPTSKIFLDRIKENPTVVGEFYGVITEEQNVSNASKFNLIISDNFTLESQPLVYHFREGQPNLVPLSVDYKSFWKMFFLGSTAYKVIQDSSYVIESQRNPVELTALNLDLKVEAQEKIKGQKHTLPIRFFIKFK